MTSDEVIIQRSGSTAGPFESKYLSYEEETIITVKLVVE